VGLNINIPVKIRAKRLGGNVAKFGGERSVTAEGGCGSVCGGGGSRHGAEVQLYGFRWLGNLNLNHSIFGVSNMMIVQTRYSGL
jgi:hypothetical protein